MIQIICGEKGKGKTKFVLQNANDAVANAQGTIVYVDKSSKNMFELNNQIRLINITEYPINTYEGFVGFISGLLSGNHDIECVFVDSLLKVAHVEGAELSDVIKTLDSINPDVKFVLSFALSEADLPADVKDKVIVSC